MPYKTKTIGWALQQVSPTSPKFFIPAMQRPYVWKKEDIVKLFTSIYLEFPIGTSLVWPTSYDNPRNLGAARAYWVETKQGDGVPPRQVALQQGENITLVLDGQQRLTSLNVGVRGAWVDNSNEFTLCFDPAVKATASLYDQPTHAQAFKFINLNSEDIGQLISCERILQWHDKNTFENWLSNYLNMNGENRNLRPEEIEENIRKLKRSFWDVEAYCYGEYPAKDVEDALNVFQLANDTGESLDKTDLILATLQISWDAGALREEVPKLVKALNYSFSGGHRPFDQKKLLNLFFLTADCSIPSAYRLKDFSASRVEALRLYWSEFQNQVTALVEQLKRWGLTNNKCISSINALIPILRWQVKNKITYITEDLRLQNEIEKARHWLLVVLLNGTFSGQSTRTISAAREVIESCAGTDFPKKTLFLRLEEFHNYDFATRDGVRRFISELKYGESNNAYVRRLLMLLKDNLRDDNFEYQIDHIFPRSNYENGYPNEVNAIANLQLLTRRENTLKNNNNPAILWNDDSFNENWRVENLLPPTAEPKDRHYIYDDPKRLWERRLAAILEKAFKILEI